MLSLKQGNRALRFVASFFAVVAPTANSAQIDIPGPSGSGEFGSFVAVLPNGNFVVTDPGRDTTVTDAGAVYLYSPTGVLISTLTGSTANDRVGDGGVRVLANGNYVVISRSWINGTAVNAGAVTWASASSGRAGVVSSSNSLVGTAADDFVGGGGFTALANGHYVVGSPNWDNGANTDAGAATWGNGSTGRAGVVSPANSLVGTTRNDRVGGGPFVALSNGHYIVVTSQWDNGAIANVGAVTWANGTTGRTGAVSSTNSLVGTTLDDAIGGQGVAEVGGGNYVVSSPMWNSGAVADVGAVTWANGAVGMTGTLSAANSLVGTTLNDRVGSRRAVPLANGNYVVTASDWDNGAVVDVGAVTWANGTTGRTGTVSAANSLIGTTSGDRVGAGPPTALTNGHYVVVSNFWNNGAARGVGAVTWCDGTTGRTGTVSPANSLIGTQTDDRVGTNGVTALTNGHYVVASNQWDNGSLMDAGAVTWGNGSSGRTGVVSAVNSLVGTTAGDRIGIARITALTNGNYVATNPYWDNGAVVDAGAVTWADGSAGRAGAVSTANSLVGTSTGDEVGMRGITALVNGHFVVSSYAWNNGPTAYVGAVTWGNGNTGITGVVSPANSLIGTTMGDIVGSDGILSLSDGKYVIRSREWDNGAIADAGAITLSRGAVVGVIGTIGAANSVRGTVTGGGANLPSAYDATRERLLVGRPASNVVSLFTLPPDSVFANGFE